MVPIIHKKTRGVGVLGLLIGAGMAAALARSQEHLPPLPPPTAGYAPAAPSYEIPPPVIPTRAPGGVLHGYEEGHIKKAIHHIKFTIKDKMIGYPEYFDQPPLGYSVRQNMGAQVARAELHSFTLYRTDFVSGTDQLTQTGAARLARMAGRWDYWNGPILVESDPSRPGLAEMRRDTILTSLQGSGLAIDPSRLVVGRSPYTGLRGDIAGGASVITGYDGIVINRSYAAPTALPLPPNQSAATVGDATGGSGQ